MEAVSRDNRPRQPMEGRKRFGLGVGVLACVVLGAATAHSAPAAPQEFDTPELLRPWIEWVLHGHEEARCPFLSGAADQRQCVWPSRLALELDARSCRLTQQWLVHRDGWVPLPGDDRLWPQDVRVDGKPAPVTQRNGTPHVRLLRGAHTITGTFEWDTLPESLPIPPATGLLALTLQGKRVPFPQRDEQGRLWLQQRSAAAHEEDRLDVVVHRRVVDDIPLQLVTRIELRVSGTGREMLLGQALPEQFTPMSLTSPLPARVDPDGHLRVQLRPGNWTIEISARHDGPVSALTLRDPAGAWDAEETWVFDARPRLRLVSVEGVPAVDPQQTELPAEWARLPAYRMRPGDTMTFVEKQRGDADPSPDRLQLQRTWWLDSDGTGYTLHDVITGTMSRSWRLEMPPPVVLGRVAVDGEDQFITRVGDATAVGVEIRPRTLQLAADSRLTGMVADVPAVGWDQDFQQVDGTLNLPPGWRLLHARGVDDAAPTWVGAWTLLDLFVVLIVALASAKLWGRPVGLLALITLGLTYIEPGSPQGVWLAVLATEALVRVLPAGRLLRRLKLARLAALVCLVIIALPFMMHQALQALYPALEQPAEPRLRTGRVADVHFAEEVARNRPSQAPQAMGRGAQPVSPPEEIVVTAHKRAGYQHEIDPKAILQTGPGLPTWEWLTVSLHWRGPVERAQRLHLLLLSPRMNLVLATCRVLLLAGLLVVVWRSDAAVPGLSRRAATASLILFGSMVAAGIARADFPPPDLLDELRNRLLEAPDCHPDCATSSRLQFEISPTTIRGRMAVDVAAETAIPLPGGASDWVPDTVVVDGQPAQGLMRASNGLLWIQLPPGTHLIQITGELVGRDSVQIPLPLKPHRIEARTEGWRVDGVHEDGLADDNLQLTRLRSEGDGDRMALQPESLRPFMRVARELQFDLTWRVVTTVTRLTPAGSAVVLEIPLLPGESVTSAGVRVAAEKVQLSMAPQATEVSWSSILPEAPTLTLAATDSLAFTEVWRLGVSPIWHVTATGIPPIQLGAGAYPYEREWQPWPGESLTIAISRPAGVPGQTFTIDRSVLSVTPGLRATDVSLALDSRSSRGGQHRLTLPESAELQSVSINNVTQPIRQEQRFVTFPVVPGTQAVHLTWRQRGGITHRFASPDVDLGTASVNSAIDISMPADRWTLFVGGPRTGPAVLFWSVLVVLLLTAVALGRVPLTPLRTSQWFLLGIGLTQSPIVLSMIVAGWLLVLGWRRRHGSSCGDRTFNLLQLLVMVWTALALAGLGWSVRQGLLGLPEMQIAGSGSHARLLHWYQDIAGETLPRAWVISVPLWAYRLAMLAWALWLAQALLGWLRWGWDCFIDGGLWRPLRRTIVAGTDQGAGGSRPLVR